MADGPASTIQYDSSNGPTGLQCNCNSNQLQILAGPRLATLQLQQKLLFELEAAAGHVGAERTQRTPGAGLVGRRFSSNNPLTKNLINWNLSVNELPLPFSDPHIYRLLATDPGRRQQKKY